MLVSTRILNPIPYYLENFVAVGMPVGIFANASINIVNRNNSSYADYNSIMFLLLLLVIINFASLGCHSIPLPKGAVPLKPVITKPRSLSVQKQ